MATPIVQDIEAAYRIGAGVDDGTDTAALTRAIAAGDTAAFTRFFDARFDEMLAEARRVTGGDDAMSHDVVQDAMMRVIRSMKPLDTETHLRRWLRTVVRSCAYDRLRRDLRRQRREIERPTETDRTDDTRRAERLEWLESELRSLDDASVDLLLMRHRFGWTLQQIGRTLGIDASAVDGRLRRLVGRLRRRAGRNHDDR